MKPLFLILGIFITNSVLSQRIISYKYDKEHEGTDMFGGRIVASAITDYTKSVPTIFIFDLNKKIVRINNKIFGIEKRDDGNYEHDRIVNGVTFLYDKTNFILTMVPKYEGDVQDPQILIEYENGFAYRYYVKPSRWKMLIEPNSQPKN